MLPDEIQDPLSLLQSDLERARALRDPTAGFGCLATVDGDGQPHARMITFRVVDRAYLQFWSFRTSPKVNQLETGRGYELTLWWSSISRQYRLQGDFVWVPAERLGKDYAALPMRAKVWDRLHEELPQSAVLGSRSELVDRYEAVAGDLEHRFGSTEAVPPSAGAGAVHLFVRHVEVEQIDLDRRLHDRRRLVLGNGGWSQVRLVP